MLQYLAAVNQVIDTALVQRPRSAPATARNRSAADVPGASRTAPSPSPRPSAAAGTARPPARPSAGSRRSTAPAAGPAAPPRHCRGAGRSAPSATPPDPRACRRPPVGCTPSSRRPRRSVSPVSDILASLHLLTPPLDQGGQFSLSLGGQFSMSPDTVTYHDRTASEFLAHIGYETHPTRLAALDRRDLDACAPSAPASRVRPSSMWWVTSELSSGSWPLPGEIPTGLDAQIGHAPRVSRRAAPAGAALGHGSGATALDRSRDPDGASRLRDPPPHGDLRPARMRGRDAHARRRGVAGGAAAHPATQTRRSLWLPLTDEVGTALLDYLRHGRHALNVRRQRVPFRGGTPRSYRELFLRCRTPAGVLKPTAVTEAFQAWSKRSGLAIPVQGAHCVRHSYAVHLLRSGLSLKTIGDLLGHRTLESTCVYLRLAVDDLRDVALPLPATVDRSAPGVAS